MKNSKTILIIGNGQSIIDNKFGAYIDQFDNIARINNYRIHSYEKYLGNKTSIWINGANQNLTIRKQQFSKVVVSVPSSIINKKGNRLLNHISNRLKMKNDDFILIPIKDIKKYEKLVGHKRLTTGMTSILWGLDNFEKVIIHGFDFFINSKSHYYDSIFVNFLNKYILNKGHKHDNRKEKKFVQQLINDNKVEKLINFIK